MKISKPLTIAVDMYGCPNRCLHCWLGHMPNRAMEPGADERIVELFKPYFEKIEFYSWVREPDFCADYRARWERDKRLCVGMEPERFELASFWRLVRDEDYVKFLSEVGVKCVQLTFFGLEETTDRYVGRKGAFRELLRATEILLANGILPRWQCFINEQNKQEIVELLCLTEDLGLKARCEAIGGSFKFFVHAGSCDGENMKLYPIRIGKSSVPKELIPYYWEYESILSERELCEKLKDDESHFVYHNEDSIVLYVSNSYDLYFNFSHMRPEWRIGNLNRDPIDELIRRVIDEDIPALRTARQMTVGELVRLYGDFGSERAFFYDDYKEFLLNTHLEQGGSNHDIV